MVLTTTVLVLLPPSLLSLVVLDLSVDEVWPADEPPEVEFWVDFVGGGEETDELFVELEVTGDGGGTKLAGGGGDRREVVGEGGGVDSLAGGEDVVELSGGGGDDRGGEGGGDWLDEGGVELAMGGEGGEGGGGGGGGDREGEGGEITEGEVDDFIGGGGEDVGVGGLLTTGGLEGGGDRGGKDGGEEEGEGWVAVGGGEGGDSLSLEGGVA